VNEMRRIIFILLIMVYTVSWAEWKLIDISSDGESITYIDRSTIRRTGSFAKMWIIHDFFAEQSDNAGDKYRSRMARLAFDCKLEMSAINANIGFSEKMGGGSVVWSHTNKEKSLDWGAIPPGSLVQEIWKIACGKK
jgi:hypothetical protein